MEDNIVHLKKKLINRENTISLETILNRAIMKQFKQSYY